MGNKQARIVQVEPGPEELAVYSKAKAAGNRATIIYTPETRYEYPNSRGDVNRNLKDAVLLYPQKREGCCGSRLTYDSRGTPYYSKY